MTLKTEMSWVCLFDWSLIKKYIYIQVEGEDVGRKRVCVRVISVEV